MKSLQEKIRKGEYSGGSGSKPPGGRGSGGGGNSDGSEEGMSDETLQVVFATIGFIFVVHTLSLYTPPCCFHSQLIYSLVLNLLYFLVKK
jgi:hypothetical protein